MGQRLAKELAIERAQEDSEAGKKKSAKKGKKKPPAPLTQNEIDLLRYIDLMNSDPKNAGIHYPKNGPKGIAEQLDEEARELMDIGKDMRELIAKKRIPKLKLNRLLRNARDICLSMMLIFETYPVHDESYKTMTAILRSYLNGAKLAEENPSQFLLIFQFHTHKLREE